MEPRARARLVEDAAERVTTQPPMLWTWAVTLGVRAVWAFLPLLAVRRVLVRSTVHALMAQSKG